MATIDCRWVKRELRALCSVSQGVKKLLQNVLEEIERDPSAFPILDNVPLDLDPYPGVAIRKAKITHRRHDYRIVFLHRRLEDDAEHVDLLFVFKRTDGYHIDWDWI